MKNIILFFPIFCGLLFTDLHSQSIDFEKARLQPVNVSLSFEKQMGKQLAKLVKDSSIKAVDQPTFVRVEGVDFKNGIIEVYVLSKLLPNAPQLSRGFIGIAFRVNNSNSKFECIYIRPVNGRSENQLQRNHSIQYFSYPDYDFERFRKESPGQYEAYADMGLNEWIKMKIEVNGLNAKLYLNDNPRPSLIINDLKHGSDLSGTIGMWVDVGTEGYFSDLKVYKQ